MRSGWRPSGYLAGFAAVIACCLLPDRAAALTLNFGAIAPEHTQMVQVTDGLESGFAASIGYGRIVRGLGWTSVLGGDVTMVMVDARDYRLRLGGTACLLRSGPWMLTARLFPSLRGASNQVSRMTSVGVEAGGGGGYFGRHWFAAAELGLDWAAATYIAHSDRYRTTVYADARDGWYSSTGTRLPYGVYGGYSWRAVDVVLRVGQARDLDFGTWFVPFYATLGINVRLP